MTGGHRGNRSWRKPPTPPSEFDEAEKRVRKAERQHRCQARCECVRTTTSNAARGCCSGSMILILGILIAVAIAVAAAAGKL